MPQVTIIELCKGDQLKAQNGLDSGDHVWIEIQFSDNRVLTIRADQCSLVDEHKTSTFIGIGDGESFDNSTEVTL